MELVERVSVKEYVDRALHQVHIKTGLVWDVLSIVGEHLRPGFVMGKDVVHDLCLMSMFMMCNHEPLRHNPLHCECSSSIEWQEDHFLAAHYKTDEFRQLLGIRGAVAPDSVDWEYVSQPIKNKYLHQPLISEDRFLTLRTTVEANVQEQIFRLACGVLSVGDVLAVTQGALLDARYVHLTHQGPVLELESSVAPCKEPLYRFRCLNCTQPKQTNSCWLYCPQCHLGPLCSQPCHNIHKCVSSL